MAFSAAYKDEELITDRVEMADSFVKRFMGLMFRKSMPQNHALLLRPCSAIHTFSMKFAIDAVFLAKDGTVLHIEPAMQPNKPGKSVKKADSVLELNAGMADEFGLKTGDMLEFKKID